MTNHDELFTYGRTATAFYAVMGHDLSQFPEDVIILEPDEYRRQHQAFMEEQVTSGLDL